MSDSYMWVLVFCLFEKIFAYEKVISKNRLHCEIKSPPHPQPTPNPSLSYSGVIRVKMFVLKHWAFLEDIWNFNKWKLLITDKKCWMSWKAMLGKR